MNYECVLGLVRVIAVSYCDPQCIKGFFFCICNYNPENSCIKRVGASTFTEHILPKTYLLICASGFKFEKKRPLPVDAASGSCVYTLMRAVVHFARELSEAQNLLDIIVNHCLQPRWRHIRSILRVIKRDAQNNFSSFAPKQTHSLQSLLENTDLLRKAWKAPLKRHHLPLNRDATQSRTFGDPWLPTQGGVGSLIIHVQLQVSHILTRFPRLPSSQYFTEGVFFPFVVIWH